MKTSEPHRMRNTVLVVFFLLGIGTLTFMYMSGNEPPDKNRFITGPDSYRVSQRIVKTTFSSFLPKWSFNREKVAISRERNARVMKSVFEVFDPSLRSFLTSVPIVFDSSADTAKAYRTKGYIGVSPDWDKTVLQSQRREIYEQRGMKPEDPVFMHRFKTDLLIHEFLHILQAHQGIDVSLWFEAVARWYADPRYGIPNPSGLAHADKTNDGRPAPLSINRIKYILWHNLYNYRRLNDVPDDESWKNMHYGARYKTAKKGVEEFAYIGEEILSSGSSSENYIKTGQWSDKDWQNKKLRLLEVSPEVIAVFRGVFNPELTK